MMYGKSLCVAVLLLLAVHTTLAAFRDGVSDDDAGNLMDKRERGRMFDEWLKRRILGGSCAPNDRLCWQRIYSS